MPTLPWTTGPERPTDTADTVVMGSYFRVRGYRHVLPFFVDAMRVLMQARRSEGALGITLEAHLLRMEFRTLSQWRDQASLDAMVRAEPHRSIMTRHRNAMEDSDFRFWRAPASTPPTWEDAMRRLAC